MKRLRLAVPLLLALLLSLLLHLGIMGSGLLSFGSIDMPDDPALRKLSAKLEGVALEADKASPPASAAVSLQAVDHGGVALATGDASAPVVQRKPKKSVPKKQQAEPGTAAIPQLATADSTAASAPASTTAEKTEQASAAKNSAVDSSAPVAEAGSELVLPPQRLAKFPDVARIEYGLLSRGILLGHGEMNWQRGQGQYRIHTTVKPVLGPTFSFESNGKISKNGLQPQSFAATRDNQPREFARFDWAAGTLEYGDKDKETQHEALKPGALDWLSMGFELALRGEQAGAAQRQVTTGKKVYQFALQLAGETDFDTGEGNIRAVVVRARNDKDLIEFWLAPDFANIPVRIMRVDNDKRFELRATLIEFNGAVLWKQPPRRQTNHEN